MKWPVTSRRCEEGNRRRLTKKACSKVSKKGFTLGQLEAAQKLLDNKLLTAEQIADTLGLPLQQTGTRKHCGLFLQKRSRSRSPT